MLRIAESAKVTDTGRQRKANEDSLFVRSPLFAIADGMGGAQAGEVASQTAVAQLEGGLPDAGGSAEERLAALVQDANAAVHALAQSSALYSGMGTTLTAAYLTESELAIAHVGDSRLYVLRDGVLERLTHDHSLVEELVREGRLSPAEADTHPQRNIITRALGAEGVVAVDHLSWRARAGDVFLICSDGLTSMIPEVLVGELLRAEPRLDRAARDLVAAANEAGGRDNITVVLFRVEEIDAQPIGEATQAHAPAPALAWDDDEERTREHPAPEPPPAAAPAAAVHERRPRPRRRPGLRRLRIGLILFALIGVPIVLGSYIASQSVWFVGSDDQGFVTLFRGPPYELPFGLDIYQRNFTSGVPVGTLPAGVRATVAAHKLRSREDAADLVKRIELGQVAP